MCQEMDVFDVVICLVLALRLLIWLPRVDTFHNAEFPASEDYHWTYP